MCENGSDVVLCMTVQQDAMMHLKNTIARMWCQNLFAMVCTAMDLLAQSMAKNKQKAMMVTDGWCVEVVEAVEVASSDGWF